MLMWGVVAAQPDVPSYSFYRWNWNHSSSSGSSRTRPVPPPQASTSPPQLASLPPQQPAPAYLASWGGTVVETRGATQLHITANGQAPCHSLVSFHRGHRLVGWGQIIASDPQGAEIVSQDCLSLSPGDGVCLETIPVPPIVERNSACSSAAGTYHPSSSNADPTYQRWLHQGFTLGRSYGRSPYSSSSYYR